MRLLPTLLLSLPLLLSTLSPSPHGSTVSAHATGKHMAGTVKLAHLRRRSPSEDSEDSDEDGTDEDGSDDGESGDGDDGPDVHAASASSSIPSKDTVEDNELKEFHFHLYFHETNPAEVSYATDLRNRIIELRDEGYFHAYPAPLHMKSVGPHPIGNLEVWTPKEEFSRVYDFVTSNRGNLTTLIHPISSQQRRDHSDRAVWLGQPLPLKFQYIRTDLGRIPKEHSGLGLGYSAQD